MKRPGADLFNKIRKEMAALQQVVTVSQPKLSPASSQRAVRNVSDDKVLEVARLSTGGVSEENNYVEIKQVEESPKLIGGPFTSG